MLLGFSLAMGLAVHSMLQHFAVSAALKWPNDVLAKGKGRDYRKICGILIENTACADGEQALRIGVGLNINQKTFPSEVPGISMRQVLGKQVDYLSVFCELSAQVVLHAEIMFSDGFCGFREKWFDNSMMNNARVKFSGEAPGGCCRWGRVMDIADDGALIVALEQAAHGREAVKIYSGEVELDNAFGN
jgi:BirA family biotin operon repressor/biotin-[acetyl-CoA-carboxylase] ligase